MKFTCSTFIDAPRDKVVALWQDPDNFKHWMDGFKRIAYTSGPPGVVGSTAKIYFEMKGKPLELREVILLNDLPDLFKARYEHVHMTNNQTVRFEVIDDQTTRYTQEIEYTEFHSFLPRLMSWLFSGFFKRPVQKWMDQFKVFVEKVT